MSGDHDVNDLSKNELVDNMDTAVDVEGNEISITEDGGVKKKILVEGQDWETPEAGDEVTVHYVGTLEDGSKFDSSRDRGAPFKFTLGKGNVIKGWDEGVATMKKGEKAILTCRSDYAYGKSGSPPKIGPDATLNFEVELLSWKSLKDIMGDGGIIKTIVADGSGWDSPKEADEVLVKYTAKVAGQDKPFAETGEEGVEFVLQEEHLVPGIAATVRTMKKGERAHLKLSPAYGFGEAGSSEHGVPAGAELQAELELVSWKKVENVTEDGLVTKKVVKESEEWKRPNEGAKVTVRYTARLQDGTVVEEHGEGNELLFTTDEDEVIDGLQRAVMKMKKGEKALITIAPKYGYGDAEHKTALGVVPPGSTLVYDAELVDHENAKESWELKDGEKVEAAAANKEKGNKAYKEGKLDKAVRYYDKAVELVNNDKDLAAEDKARAKELKKSCWLNLAAVQLRRKEWKEVVKSCDKVLETDPTNVKALYRRAQAYIGTLDYLEAELDLKRGLESEPQNPDLTALLKKLKQLQRVQNKKESQMYGRMFKALGGGKGAKEGEGKENSGPVEGVEEKVEAGEKVAAGEPMDMDGNATSA